MSQAKRTDSYGELSIPERIELLQRLWDELATEPDSIELTDAQRTELERRLEDHRQNPGDGISWESLRTSLRSAP